MEIQNMDWTKNNILFTPQENQLLMCFCFCFFELYTKVMCSRDWDFGDAKIVTVTGQNCTVTGQNCTVKNKQTNVCPPLLRCVLNFLKRVLLKIICVENTQYRTIVLYITPRPCNDALYNSDCYCWITMYCSTTQTKSLLSLHINSRVNLEALRHKHLNREALTCNIWRICTHMHIIAWPTAHWLDSTYQNSTSKNIPLTFIN